VISNQEFLNAVFGEDAAWAHVCAFPDDPSNISTDRRFLCWGGDYASRSMPLQQGTNQYYTISTFYADEQGKARRRKALFRATHVIVADDVKEKLPLVNVLQLPPPSYKLETSPGSEQWGWILDVPCTDRSKVENLLDGLVAQGLAPAGKDPGMKGVTRYVRLPEGGNTKASRVQAHGGTAPRCRMLEWTPGRVVSIEELAVPFRVDINAERRDTRVDGAAAVDDHPLLDLADIINVKSIRSDGRFDITCPWVLEHTNAADDGAAVFTNADGSIGFKCHHGSCEGRTGRDLLDRIEKDYPGFRKRLEGWKILRQFGSVLQGQPGMVANPSPQQPVVHCQSLNFLDPPPLDFLGKAPTPAPQAQAGVFEPQPDQLISYQTLIDQLKLMPPGSDQSITAAYAILKAIDTLDHGTRLQWQNQIRDHMQWSKNDLASILDQQRQEWYPQRVQRSDFFDECIYVSAQNQFYNPAKRIWLTPDAYQNTYAHLNEDARHEALREGRTQKVDFYDYAPGLPRIFEEQGVRYVNGWTDMPDSGIPGDVTRWLSHFDVLGWGEHRKHMLQWMAYTLRHPERKINHVLILGGGEGTGKDFILYPLAMGMGRETLTIDADVLMESFHEHMIGTKYMHINESEMGDRKESRIFSNKMKPLACSPPERLRANIKGTKPAWIRNIVNCTMTSNSALPVTLPGDGRRYYGVWTDLKIRDEHGQVTPEWAAYWRDRWYWIRDCQGWRACVHYLMTQVDLSDFDPGAVPLVTDFIKEIQEASEDPLTGIIKEIRDKRLSTLAVDLVTAQDVHLALKSAPMLGLSNSIKVVPPPAVIGKVIKQEGLGICARAWRGKENLRLIIMRHPERYIGLGGGELADLYYQQHQELKARTALSLVPKPQKGEQHVGQG